MSLITLEKAAARLGTPLKTIEEWAQQGWLNIHEQGSTLTSNLGSVEKLVEEDQLLEIAETLGWLELSGDRWDETEDE